MGQTTSFPNSEVSSFQGAVCSEIENSSLGPDEVSPFHRVSSFHRVCYSQSALYSINKIHT
jgi:hypothetical protein